MPWTHRGFWIAPGIIFAILLSLSAIVARTRLRRVYRERFVESRRERMFLAAIGYFVAIAVVRGLTLAIHWNIGPFHDVSMGGRHIHHLVWGILLLLLTGYGWLLEIGNGSSDSSPWMGRFTSMLYGVAAALTLDEFALWLNLRDVYWGREGRESFEAMSLFAAVLCAGVAGKPFLHGIYRELTGRGGKRDIAYHESGHKL
jgi:hypothetical protein